MKRTLTALLTLGLACMALTLGSYKTVFVKAYGLKDGSKVETAGCMACHEKKSGGKLNAYGQDLQKALKGSKKITPDVLHSIDKLDSNKNGKSNADDIKSDVLPG